jgi:hypothetical protein
MVLESTQPPIQWVPEALSLGIKRPGREADHSPPSSDVVKECVELYLHSSNTPSWSVAQLQKKKHMENITFNSDNWNSNLRPLTARPEANTLCGFPSACHEEVKFHYM